MNDGLGSGFRFSGIIHSRDLERGQQTGIQVLKIFLKKYGDDTPFLPLKNLIYRETYSSTSLDGFNLTIGQPDEWM